MPVAHKTSLASASKGGATLPDFPAFSPRLLSTPGAEETNAEIRRWNSLMKRRWAVQDNDVQKGFRDERTYVVNQNFALATRIETTEASLGGVSSDVTELSTALVTVEGYLEARWTLQATAGDVVTGMTIFSASGPDTTVSYVAFQADRFQINTSTGGRKEIFSATATEVKLGDVLTVDLDNAKVFIGSGTFGNASTPFYVDSLGRLSLNDRFTWDGSTLAFSGTGSNGDYVEITDSGFKVGGNSSQGVFIINNNSGNAYLNFRYNGNVYGSWAIASTYSALQLSDNGTSTVILDGRGNPGVAIIGPAANYGLTVSNDALISGDLEIGGTAQFGTHTAIGAETVTGFITVKDFAGNTRKLAVVS